MKDISRREFLRMACLGVGALVAGAILEACSRALPLVSPGASKVPDLPDASASPAASGSPSTVATPAPSTSVVAATPLPSSAPGASGAFPDLVVVRKGEPEMLVRRAIAALGGMERFVAPGQSVIVKPNICVAYRTYEYAATTNPWVVGTLVKMALEAGASSVKVLDYPYGGSAADGYATSGIKQQVEAAGGQMIVMSSRGFVSTPLPAGKWLKRTDIYGEILKADVLINAPIAKQHGSSRVTAGMKNLMGLVKDRPVMHGNLGQAIADLNTVIRPALTVVDGIRILTRNGPSGGSLKDVKKLDTIVASADVVAADAYTASFFGLKPNDLSYVKIGAAMGLGRSDLSKLRIEELSV
jgi:uncharacterized protein (DUF362 family)